MGKWKRRIKNQLTKYYFKAYSRKYAKNHEVEKNTVLFLSDVRGEIGGNMKFVADWLPDTYEIRSDFKADRRDPRGKERFQEMIRNMTTCQYIILEDYFRYTSFMNVRPGQQICQLWHGAGAYKKFGFSREGNSEHISIHPGYRKYAKAITSADAIRPCYAEAFDISIDKVQATGIPRTDIFFDEEYIRQTREELFREYPFLKGKKVILFAPTYRGIRAFDAAYDFDRIQPELFYDQLGDDYIFLFKWHPATYNNLERDEISAYDLEKYNGFFRDFSQERDINDLLLITDVLITDYSSVIFDYLLVNKPIVYYAYDLEDYQGGRGLYFSFEEYVYGKVARTQEELIDALKAEDMCEEKRAVFRKKFMEACDGNSTEKTCRWIFEEKLP